MKKRLLEQICTDDYLGCYGNFDVQDTVCKRYCALSLRCAIEREQNDRLEILEDLMASEQSSFRFQ